MTHSEDDDIFWITLYNGRSEQDLGRFKLIALSCFVLQFLVKELYSQGHGRGLQQFQL